MLYFISPGLFAKNSAILGENVVRLIIGKFASRTCTSSPCWTCRETNFLNETPCLFSRTIAIDSFGLSFGAVGFFLFGKLDMMCFLELLDRCCSLLASTCFRVTAKAYPPVNEIDLLSATWKQRRKACGNLKTKIARIFSKSIPIWQSKV